MLATNIKFVPHSGHTCLRQQRIMASEPDELTITTISVFATEMVITTTESIPVTSYAPHMKVSIAGTNSALNGIWEIKSINYTAKTITCFKKPESFIAGLPVTTGTVNVEGVCHIHPWLDGTAIYNNHGDMIEMRYDTAGTYLIDRTAYNETEEDLWVQITNHGTSSAVFTISYSVDLLNWSDTEAFATVAAGKTSKPISLITYNGLYVKLVTATTELHSINVR